MNWNGQRYEDRFGNVWFVQAASRGGKPRRVLFTCGEFQLVAADDEATGGADMTATRLKELFCEAERVVLHEKEKWYVGFRKRTGRGGRLQGGMHTRFRSESGEVRYANGMLHFRHMPQDALCELLTAARRAAGGSARIRWAT
jgi:hypothetical protein